MGRGSEPVLTSEASGTCYKRWSLTAATTTGGCASLELELAHLVLVPLICARLPWPQALVLRMGRYKRMEDDAQAFERSLVFTIPLSTPPPSPAPRQSRTQANPSRTPALGVPVNAPSSQGEPRVFIVAHSELGYLCNVARMRHCGL